MKSIGIVGATGAVGQEIIKSLHSRSFPVDAEHLHLFGSERSAGKTMKTPFGPLITKAFSMDKMAALDIVFLAVSGSFSKEYAEAISQKGPVVIDNSSAFRMNESVPLVVPEINAASLKGQKLIANPNCTTAILAVALYPLHREFSVTKCMVATYQATSGGGAEAMQELEHQSKNYLEGKSVTHEKFAHPIPFNLIPHIDTFQENGYTREEMKVAHETRKIFNDPELKISCTAVRIPTFRAHAESVVIETEKPINPNRARDILRKAPGVEVVDDPLLNRYPMPLTASNKEKVEVGRIRQNLVFGEHGLEFFICGDQLLKGAALNAVQIAEVINNS